MQRRGIAVVILPRLRYAVPIRVPGQEPRPVSISAWIILGIIVVVVVWGSVSYNRLIAMRQQCNQGFADIDVQLKQRHDLVPNLVETVKGYAGHERGTLDAVVQARNAAATAQGPVAKAQAETLLGGAMRQLFALAEAYPDLKANSTFQQLQAQLTSIENRLADARHTFNGMVQGYNSMIQQFPTVLFASALGFAPHEFFNIGDERQTLGQALQVRF
jgi:LemA protein